MNDINWSFGLFKVTSKQINRLTERTLDNTLSPVFSVYVSQSSYTILCKSFYLSQILTEYFQMFISRLKFNIFKDFILPFESNPPLCAGSETKAYNFC